MTKEKILDYPAVRIDSIYKLADGTIFLLGSNLGREAYELPDPIRPKLVNDVSLFAALDKERLSVAKIIHNYTCCHQQEAIVEISAGVGDSQGIYIFRDLNQGHGYWEVIPAVYFGGTWVPLSASVPSRGIL